MAALKKQLFGVNICLFYFYRANTTLLEPDVRIFLTTIVQSMSWIFLWMLLNTFFGIKLGLLFLDEKVTAWHIVYYVGMVGSFIWVLRHIIAKWKKVPNFDRLEDDSTEL